MDIHTVRDNLVRTIAGKQELLNQLESRKDAQRAPVDQIAYIATMEMLKENIRELTLICKEVVECVDAYSEAYNQGWNDALVKERGGYE